MPLIIKNRYDRLAFQFGTRSALRSTSELVDQVQAQLKAERNQHAFDVAQFQEQIAILSRQLAEARYEIAKRDRENAFAEAPSPSTMTH
jgi:hypothetical protein